MTNDRSRRFVGTGLIVVGVLFLLVANHILLGWEHIWPLFPLLGGVFFLRVFVSKREPELLFAGVSGTLLGGFLLLFSLNIVGWDRMGVLWPVLPLIAALSMLTTSIYNRKGGTSMIVGGGIILFCVVAFMLESGAIHPRVAMPFVRFWPLVFIVAGVVILKMVPRPMSTHDPDMDAVREVLEADEKNISTEDRIIPPGLDTTIIDNMRAAGNPSDAVAALVHGLKANFSRFSWVGVYRLEGDTLVLGDGDYVGQPPEHREIKLPDGICGAVAAARKTEVVADVCNDDRYLACSPTVKSEIVVPMFDGNDVIGVLDIDSDELDAFNEDDRRFLEALTKRATPFVRVAQEST